MASLNNSRLSISVDTNGRGHPVGVKLPGRPSLRSLRKITKLHGVREHMSSWGKDDHLGLYSPVPRLHRYYFYAMYVAQLAQL